MQAAALTTLRRGRWISHSLKKKAKTAAALQPMTAPFLSDFSNCDSQHQLSAQDLPEQQAAGQVAVWKSKEKLLIILCSSNADLVCDIGQDRVEIFTLGMHNDALPCLDLALHCATRGNHVELQLKYRL